MVELYVADYLLVFYNGIFDCQRKFKRDLGDEVSAIGADKFHADAF